jgi:protein phosphatase
MTSPTTRVPRPRAALTARGAGLSHPGLAREVNEDAILTDPSGALWAIADGMGGYGHGDIAADIVIDQLARLPYGAPGEAVAGALMAANDAVRARAREKGIAAMGATVVAALLDGGLAAIYWAGDSRAYVLRGGALTPLTRDHSVVQELVELGRIVQADARSHPQGHVVTRAVGAADRLEVDRAEVSLAEGDRLLLCSDGLSGCVPEPQIASVLASASDPEAACRGLVEAALEHGGPDNVSVVVVGIGGTGAR